ncbi:MAG: HAMP domain-containing methyl-accepting chemotaxis protein [Thermodesulfobacteriota bacterium]
MKWFKNLRVGARLILGFSVMICFMAGIGAAGYLGSASIEKQLRQIFTVNLPGIDYLIEADRDFQQLLVAERTMIFAGATTELFAGLVKEYETNLQQAGERWEKYKSLAVNPKEQEIIPRFEQARSAWQVISRQVVENCRAGTPEGERLAVELSLGQARMKFEEMRDFIDQLTEINLQMAQAAHQRSQRNYKTVVITLVLTLAAGLLAGIVLILELGRGVTRPLQRVIAGLSAAAEQITAGSGHLAAASQTLAEGASEQAAAIEETSASMEEFTSMTRANAENAGQARTMMVTASGIVQKVSHHMEQMTGAITEINRTSEETGKIIKTIDEIAFQTNLLALNAAVEAARAGEAGAGFAVVADEVRNLAMRAAEAAKNTAQLIDDTMKAVKNGNELTRATQDAFAENMDIARKVGELVEEIAGASAEQAKGIEQINRAIVEMDSVVQRVAANAEESSSTAEEMSAQAEQMKVMVEDLATLAGHGAAGVTRAGGGGKPKGPAQRSVSGQPGPARPTGGEEPQMPKALPGRRVKAEEVIPLDDEEFTRF